MNPEKELEAKTKIREEGMKLANAYIEYMTKQFFNNTRTSMREYIQPDSGCIVDESFLIGVGAAFLTERPEFHFMLAQGIITMRR